MNQETETTAIPEKEERMWGMLCHLTALSGFIIPFGSILGPLIIWLIKREEMPFVDDQGKEALNFQLTMLIAFIIACVLMFVFIGFLLIVVLCIYDIIMVVIASMKSNEGVRYRYPWAIRFIQ